MNDARGSNFLETTTQTVSWFNKRLQEDELVLKPLFQRNPVWTNSQKSYLIDSILRGYPVPEIYLQTVEDAEGNERHLVVDGQQRIRACLEFTAGGFTLAEDGADWDGDLFEDLSSDRKKQIRQYKFSVRVLPELSDALLREIFGRLNRNNMALNKQELRNATYWGEFIDTMKHLADLTFWVESGVFTANDFRRMLDVEFVSELAIAVLFGQQNKKDNLDRFYADFEEEFPAKAEVRRTFELVCAALRQVIDWDSSTRWKRKSDFYTLFSYFAEIVSLLPLDREDVARHEAKLKTFSAEVSEYLSLDHSAPDAVRDYARSVQRAASDLQNRRVRLSALTAYVKDQPYTRPPSARAAAEVSANLDSLVLEVEPNDEVDDADES